MLYARPQSAARGPFDSDEENDVPGSAAAAATVPHLQSFRATSAGTCPLSPP